MRIVAIHEVSVPVSRYADPAVASGGLTTSLVAVTTDALRDGQPVVGYGFASIGRFAQGGLIRERFGPRLLNASEDKLVDHRGTNLDPLRAWDVMMAGEKPGGHGERCVAVGALDMALWDIAAKVAGLPLHCFLADRLGRVSSPHVSVYASGGYLYPHDDLAQLSKELRAFVDQGFTRVKMKIGGTTLDQDRRRIQAAIAQLPSGASLAVDAMNTYGDRTAHAAARMLSDFDLWWFEDICDPLDFATQADVAATYGRPIAAGEALFSLAEAKLLDMHGGLRRDRDILLFDPVHCYGLPGFLKIVEHFVSRGWPRQAFWPHGGHLFCQHIVAALGLGGAEINPFAFGPFRGPAEGTRVANGSIDLPQVPGIGFEAHRETWASFRSLRERSGADIAVH